MDVRLTSGTTNYISFGTPATTSTTVNQTSNATYKQGVYSSYQAIITGTGVVSATITILGSNEDATYAGTKANWVNMGTITLSGTATATDGFTTTAPWKYTAVSVSAITGTGATVQVLMGV